MAGFAGTGCSFLVGAVFVDDVQSTSIPKVGNNYNLNSTQERKYQDQISVLLYVEAGVMLIKFVAVHIYYPARPPKPPSYPAATGRVDFKNGLKSSSRITIFCSWFCCLKKNRSLWRMVFSFGPKFIRIWFRCNS